MATSGDRQSSPSPTWGKMALIGLLGCGIGIGLVGGLVGFHEGGMGQALAGFAIGGGVGALLGLVMSPVAYLVCWSNYRAAERVRTRARARKNIDGFGHLVSLNKGT